MTAQDVFGIVGTTQAGNFHVERVVAEGGYGVVYRAMHSGFRAPVALKCLKVPEQLSDAQRRVFLEKFREEAELMFRLSAAIPEVVRPLHVDVLKLDDGRFVPFLALEWLEGDSLDALISKRAAADQPPLGLHRLIKLLRPVAHALSRAHNFPTPEGPISIVHRDLKPENIFVAIIGGAESVKILDFGIAKAKSAASQAAGRITGRVTDEDDASTFTPAYGAPEQWSPKRFGETGPWTDVWGLALTMVEAISGAPPIDGDNYVMRKIALDDMRRPTPEAMGVAVPPEVERVFQRALAVDPKGRIKDMEGFWSALEIAAGLPPSLGKQDKPKVDLGAAVTDDRSAAIGVDRRRDPEASARLARVELQKKRDAGLEAQLAPAPRARAPQPSSSELEFDLAAPPSSRRAPGLASQARIEEPPPSRRLPKRAPEDAGDSLELALPSVRTPIPESPKRPSSPPLSNDLQADASRLSSPGRGSLTSEPGLRPSQDLGMRRSQPGYGGGSASAPPRAREPANVGRDSAFAGRSIPEPEVSGDHGVRLATPILTLVVALAIGAIDVGCTKMQGAPLMLGPIRPIWIATPLAVVGMALTLWRLISASGGEHR